MSALSDAAFAGFFFGEGCLDMMVDRNKGFRIRPRPRARIGLRADDHAVLRQFQNRFGGSLYGSRRYDRADRSLSGEQFERGPMARWDLIGAVPVAGLLAVLEVSPLVSAKAEQVRLMRQVVEILIPLEAVIPSQFPVGVMEELARLKSALSAAKSYQSKRLDAPEAA